MTEKNISLKTILIAGGAGFTADTVFAATPTSEGSAVVQTVLWEQVPEEAAAVFYGTLSLEMTWFFLLVGVLSCAIAGYLIVRSEKRETVPADEYVIIEDIIESVDD